MQQIYNFLVCLFSYNRLYSESPSLQIFIVPETLREREDVNITCIVDGGRPIPIVFFNISGSKLSSAFLHASSSSYKNILTLTTFKREWNKENIMCCWYNKWYKNKEECSSPKQVDYFCTFSLHCVHIYHSTIIYALDYYHIPFYYILIKVISCTNWHVRADLRIMLQARVQPHARHKCLFLHARTQILYMFHVNLCIVSTRLLTENLLNEKFQVKCLIYF